MFTNINKSHGNNSMLGNEMESNQLPPLSPSFIRPSVLSSASGSHAPFTPAINIEQLSSTASMPHGSSHPFQQRTNQPSNSSQPLQMPVSTTPWQCPVWMSNPDILPGSYMTFNGQRQAHPSTKRKASSDWNPIIKSKQLVTEEKMAAYLNSIHISSDYTSHSSGDDMNCDKIANSSNSENNEACSVQDIEQKLRQANRITVADVVRTITNDPLLPVAILERFERPSKALVLWQPPQRLTELILSRATQETHQTQDDINNNNNNVEFEDANDVAQMDLDT